MKVGFICNEDQFRMEWKCYDCKMAIQSQNQFQQAQAQSQSQLQSNINLNSRSDSKLDGANSSKVGSKSKF